MYVYKTKEEEKKAGESLTYVAKPMHTGGGKGRLILGILAIGGVLLLALLFGVFKLPLAPSLVPAGVPQQPSPITPVTGQPIAPVNMTNVTFVPVNQTVVKKATFQILAEVKGLPGEIQVFPKKLVFKDVTPGADAVGMITVRNKTPVPLNITVSATEYLGMKVIVAPKWQYVEPDKDATFTVILRTPTLSTPGVYTINVEVLGYPYEVPP
jgi:hypothetical protein